MLWSDGGTFGRCKRAVPTRRFECADDLPVVRLLGAELKRQRVGMSEQLRNSALF